VYFRSWFVWVKWNVVFPRVWFPELQTLTWGFFFPGGASIGVGLCVNLLASTIVAMINWCINHWLRGRAKVEPMQLLLGTVILAFGTYITTMVILSGHNRSGLQGEAPVKLET